MGDSIQRWADAAMYRSQPMPEEARAPGGGTRPSVRLLNATSDPLGTLAAVCSMYTGKPVYGLAEVTDDLRREALENMRNTKLDGPLEAIQFCFRIDGVTRSFTHQAVRSRFSFIAQESMRFAVVEGESWVDRSAYPPSLSAEPESLVAGPEEMRRRELDPKYEWYSEPQEFSSPEARDYAMRRDAWDDAIIVAQQAYQKLIDAGVPAEDARGLMPHAITTRYMWVVSLRTLLAEAGKRLCTQAQFEWRLVMAEIAKAIRHHSIYPAQGSTVYDHEWASSAWQFEAIADLLQPVCYAEGKCGFMAAFDRGCRIRERVNANAAAGRPSAEWGREGWSCKVHASEVECGEGCKAEHVRLLPILPKEWLADPNAAR